MVDRTVVIGAGVYGAAVTAALARRGARVTVTDAGMPGGGTSGATFSWTNSCGKQPRVYHDLSVAGMAAHRQLAADVPGSDWYHEGGNLEWAADDAGHDRLREKVAGVLDYGYEARWLSRAEALRLEPDIDPAALPPYGIAFFPREGWVEPTRLIGHLLATAVSRGAELVRNDAVTAVERGGGMVRAVRLASGRRIPVAAVVNCAGPRAAEVGNLRPDGAGRVLLHSQETDGAASVRDTGEISVAQSAVEQVVAAGRALYPGLRAAVVESVRVGERPIPATGCRSWAGWPRCPTSTSPCRTAGRP
jgi:glycine/D-amino acid oxidase-like deaminating enzyme